MRFLRSSCCACSHNDRCPSRTRMYVNYCGADRARVTDRIRRAESECRGRQGHTVTFRTTAPMAAAFAFNVTGL